MAVVYILNILTGAKGGREGLVHCYSRLYRTNRIGHQPELFLFLFLFFSFPNHAPDL